MTRNSEKEIFSKFQKLLNYCVEEHNVLFTISILSNYNTFHGYFLSEIVITNFFEVHTDLMGTQYIY